MSTLNENRAPFRETTLPTPHDSREVVNVLTHTSNVPSVDASLPQRNPHGGAMISESQCMLIGLETVLEFNLIRSEVMGKHGFQLIAC